MSSTNAFSLTDQERTKGNRVGAAASWGSLALCCAASVLVSVAVSVPVTWYLTKEAYDTNDFAPLAWFTGVSAGSGSTKSAIPIYMNTIRRAGGFEYVNLTIPAESIAPFMSARWESPSATEYTTVGSIDLFSYYAAQVANYGVEYNLDVLVNPYATLLLEPVGTRLVSMTVQIHGERFTSIYPYHVVGITSTADGGSFELELRVPTSGNLASVTSSSLQRHHAFDKDMPHFHIAPSAVDGYGPTPAQPSDLKRMGPSGSLTSTSWVIVINC